VRLLVENQANSERKWDLDARWAGRKGRPPTYRDAEAVGVFDAQEGADGDRAVRRQGSDDLNVDDLWRGRKTGGKRRNEEGRKY
jgi:hypothetical protein